MNVLFPTGPVSNIPLPNIPFLNVLSTGNLVTNIHLTQMLVIRKRTISTRVAIVRMLLGAVIKLCSILHEHRPRTNFAGKIGMETALCLTSAVSRTRFWGIAPGRSFPRCRVIRCTIEVTVVLDMHTKIHQAEPTPSAQIPTLRDALLQTRPPMPTRNKDEPITQDLDHSIKKQGQLVDGMSRNEATDEDGGVRCLLVTIRTL